MHSNAIMYCTHMWARKLYVSSPHVNLPPLPMNDPPHVYMHIVVC